MSVLQHYFLWFSWHVQLVIEIVELSTTLTRLENVLSKGYVLVKRSPFIDTISKLRAFLHHGWRFTSMCSCPGGRFSSQAKTVPNHPNPLLWPLLWSPRAIFVPGSHMHRAEIWIECHKQDATIPISLAGLWRFCYTIPKPSKKSMTCRKLTSV